MRISYSYSNYPHSQKATMWSKRASYLKVASVVFVFIWMFILIAPFVALVPESDDYGVVIIPAIAIAIVIQVAIVRACRRKEREWAAFDGIRMQIGRELSDAEKKHVRQQLKNQQRAAKR